MKKKIKFKFKWLFKNQIEIKKFWTGLIIASVLAISQITTLYWLGVERINLETYDKNYREEELVKCKIIDKFTSAENGMELGYLKFKYLGKTFSKQVPMLDYKSKEVGSNFYTRLTYSDYMGETKNFNYLYYLVIFSALLLVGSAFITYLISIYIVDTSREFYLIRRIAEENGIEEEEEEEVMNSFITKLKYELYNILAKTPIILSIASTFVFFIGNSVYTTIILMLI